MLFNSALFGSGPVTHSRSNDNGKTDSRAAAQEDLHVSCWTSMIFHFCAHCVGHSTLQQEAMAIPKANSTAACHEDLHVSGWTSNVFPFLHSLEWAKSAHKKQ